MARKIALVAAVVLYFVTGNGDLAYGATFSVTKTVDTDDGSCDADCSLREAITAANLVPGSTVVIPGGTYVLSISGRDEDANATGDIDITTGTTISGAGAATTIVDGGGLDRVFHIVAGAVVISGLTVRNGLVPGPYGDGGGISNAGTLTLTGVAVIGNTAGYGGGLSNPGGAVAASNIIVSGNAAAGAYNDSAQGQGGGIYNTGTMVLTGSTVSGNTAGGLSWFGPGGGGMYNQGVPSTNNVGSLTLKGSTVSGNMAGAGVVNLDGTLTVDNSTISGNTSSTGFGGGGVLNFSWLGHATTTVISSTLAENRNTATRGDAIADPYGVPGSLTVRNSILASPATGLGSDCYISGAITSLGHNIDSDGSCALSDPGDMSSIDPVLGALGDHGGPTRTHVPIVGSPVIDAVPPASCTSSTDQRGVLRPQGAGCEIGSVEFALAPTSKDQCKNGGWKTFTFPRTFQNQGDCIKFATKGQ